MIKHHPDTEMLLEYASGVLDWGLSLAVVTHLHYCPTCRAQLKQMADIGGSLLSEVEPEPVKEDALDNVLNRIDAAEAEESRATETTDSKTDIKLSVKHSDKLMRNLPPVVNKLLLDNRSLKWKKIMPGFKMARLQSGQGKYEVALHRLQAGRKVAEHGHKGVEVTVVMEGCFSDKRGVYSQGDLLVMEPGRTHRPTAALNQDCLCFSVSESPVQLTGIVGKFVNPFLSVKRA